LDLVLRGVEATLVPDQNMTGTNGRGRMSHFHFLVVTGNGAAACATHKPPSTPIRQLRKTLPLRQPFP